MKLETIKAAIKEWYYINDFVDDTFKLLNQDVMFRINPEVIKSLKKSKDECVHAYPGVLEGELKFFLINSELDNKIRFDDQTDPVTNHIYVEDVIEMDEKLMSKFLKVKSSPNENIEPKEAKDRISRWSMTKKSWIKNQINNTEGIFEAFVIPIGDIDPVCDIYAIFALTDKLTADLIIWDTADARNYVLSEDNDGLRDFVIPVPPYGDGDSIVNKEGGKTDKNSFYLLNYSIQ